MSGICGGKIWVLWSGLRGIQTAVFGLCGPDMCKPRKCKGNPIKEMLRKHIGKTNAKEMLRRLRNY